MNTKLVELWAKGWRFLVTGITSNVLLYCFFLFLLWLEVPYQAALTITYVLGMLWGYLVNKYWSWKDESSIVRSGLIYILVYGLVYIAHLSFVTYLVDKQSIEPAWATLISFICLTIPLFISLNKLVYRAPKPIKQRT